MARISQIVKISYSALSELSAYPRWVQYLENKIVNV